MERPIYLDHNSTTPLAEEVADEMRRCWTAPYVNPASQHAPGRAARHRLEEARERSLQILGGVTHGMASDHLIFTSGGTEANNLAMFGLIGGRNASPGHMIVSAIEHPSVTAAARYLEHRGWHVDWLGVDSRCVVDPTDVADRLRADTRLVALMLGNNVTGVLQPVAEVAALCRRANVPVHTDAAQVIGKIAVDFQQLGVSSLSLAAHKFHGPCGVGALLLRHDARLVADLWGGPQQGALRPGTEPVALAAGLQTALELWHAERATRSERLAVLRNEFEERVLAGYPEAVVLGRQARRLPHVSNLALRGLDRQAMFMALDQAGIACSTGSACASGSSDVSPVHVAMGCEPDVAESALRFSFGATSTPADAVEAAERVARVAASLRRR